MIIFKSLPQKISVILILFSNKDTPIYIWKCDENALAETFTILTHIYQPLCSGRIWHKVIF